MEQVAPGVYVETRYVSGNVSIIVTGSGVVCVDVPMLPSDAHHWQAQIASVTNEPITTLIQTDYDRERIVSTYLFQVPLIAHDAAWSRMRVYGSDKIASQISDLLRQDGVRHAWQVRMPDVTFSERLVLYKGQQEIQVLYGGGHSPAASMVYVPGQNVILTGDVVFSNVHPTMATAETRDWLAVLTALRKMPVDVVVPGHGSVCDREATHTLSDYIRDIRASVRRNFQAGRSKSESSSAAIVEFMDTFAYDESKREQVRQRIKNGSDRIYDEYRAESKAVTTVRGKRAVRRTSGRRRRLTP